MIQENDELIFLGTGTSQGIPIIGSTDPVCLSEDFRDKRLRTSAFISYKGVELLIDCGPDFRQQMLREGKINVDAVLITHEHTDHIIGLDDLRPINFIKEKDIPLYGLNRVLNVVRDRFPYAFEDEKYPGAPGFELCEVSGKFEIGKVSIEPIYVMHGQLSILGYKIGDIAYITDASYISEQEIEKIKNVKVLVINALRKEKHHSHFCLSQALEIIERIKPEQAFLTHISFQLGFHEKVEQELPDNVRLAYDGLRILL